MQNFNLEEEYSKVSRLSQNNDQLRQQMNTSQPMYDPYYNTLKTAEEKRLEEWKTCKNDEELARRLQQLEIQKNPTNSLSTSQLREVSSNDENFALRLLREEKLEDERKRNELLKKQQEDELYALNMQEEERRRKQLEEDEKLAKKLQQEQSYSRIPPPPPFDGYSSYNQFTPYRFNSTSIGSSYNQISTSNTTPISSEKRQHALTVHNGYCSCGKTSTWNNNHIFDLHLRYCGCDLFNNYRNYFNQGKKHEHDYRCCTLNHLHSIGCKCYYRDHLHGETCCQTYHKHTKFCHCSHK